MHNFEHCWISSCVATFLQKDKKIQNKTYLIFKTQYSNLINMADAEGGDEVNLKIDLLPQAFLQLAFSPEQVDGIVTRVEILKNCETLFIL